MFCKNPLGSCLWSTTHSLPHPTASSLVFYKEESEIINSGQLISKIFYNLFSLFIIVYAYVHEVRG